MAWAIGRLGGHLRVDPGPAEAGFDEREDLLDDARRWHRVRDDAILEPAAFVGRVMASFLGAAVDSGGGRLELAPAPLPGWRSLAVRRLRVHRTLVDVEVRPRAEWVTVRLAVMFGPPIAVRLALPEQVVSRIAVDEVPLQGDAAIFTAAGEHEVTFYLGRPDPEYRRVTDWR